MPDRRGFLVVLWSILTAWCCLPRTLRPPADPPLIEPCPELMAWYTSAGDVVYDDQDCMVVQIISPTGELLRTEEILRTRQRMDAIGFRNA